MLDWHLDRGPFWTSVIETVVDLSGHLAAHASFMGGEFVAWCEAFVAAAVRKMSAGVLLTRVKKVAGNIPHVRRWD